MKVTVGTTATTIMSGATGDSVNRVALLITLPSATATESVYLEIRNSTGTANTDAAVATGYELIVGGSIGVELLPGDVLTGIVETTEQILDVLRSG